MTLRTQNYKNYLESKDKFQSDYAKLAGLFQTLDYLIATVQNVITFFFRSFFSILILNRFFFQEQRYDARGIVDNLKDVMKKIKKIVIIEQRPLINFGFLNFKPEITFVRNYYTNFQNFNESFFDVCILYYLIRGKRNILLFCFFFHSYNFLYTERYLKIKNNPRTDLYEQSKKDLQNIISSNVTQYPTEIQKIKDYVKDLRKWRQDDRFLEFKRLEE